MQNNQTSRILNFTGAVILTFLGSLLAVATAAVFVGLFEIRVDLTDFPTTPKKTDFLYIAVPGLFLFVGISRAFPRWPALFANCLFAHFLTWRAFAHGKSVFEWTLLCAIILIAGAVLSYPRAARHPESSPG